MGRRDTMSDDDDDERRFCRECKWQEKVYRGKALTRLGIVQRRVRCMHPANIANYGTGERKQCSELNNNGLCERFEGKPFDADQALDELALTLPEVRQRELGYLPQKSLVWQAAMVATVLIWTTCVILALIAVFGR